MFQNQLIPSERLIKQLDEIIFLREELWKKNNTIKCVLDQLSKRDATVCSNTERPSYRNQLIIASC